MRYPFPGWNEGFNTTAPLMYLILKGHRAVPMGEDTALDVIPVDFIAAGMLLATAAVLAGEHEPVYQLGSSDVNRVTSKRLTELTALAVRQVLPGQGRPRRGRRCAASCGRGSRRCRSATSTSSAGRRRCSSGSRTG